VYDGAGGGRGEKNHYHVNFCCISGFKLNGKYAFLMFA
jgi:hypothetical protein